MFAKEMSNIKNIQKVFNHRAKMNGLSSKGELEKLRKREYSLNKLKEKIYLISPLKIRSNFIKDLKKVLLSNKLKFFQVRFKNLSEKKIISFVKKIKPTIKNKNIKLIINDSYIIAKKAYADGCHLGQKDGSLKKARRELKKKL